MHSKIYTLILLAFATIIAFASTSLDDVPAGNVPMRPTATCTVTFDANGGPCGTTRIVAAGAPVGPLPVPSWSGHTFSGWFTDANGGRQISDSTVVTSDVTFYAQWGSVLCKIIFDANGGDGTMAPQEFAEGEEVSLVSNAFTRVGYMFACWMSDEDSGSTIHGNGHRVKFSRDTTILYAQWTPNVYLVTLDAAGGVASTGLKEATYDSPYGDLPTPTKDGGYFEGWFTEASGGSKVTSATRVTTASNHTLHAHWAPAPVAEAYTISFYENGGDGTMAPQEFAQGAEVVLSDNAFTRVGYMFGHWSTDPDGGGAIYGNKQRVKLSQDTALYAQWTPNVYLVTLDAAGGVASTGLKEATYGLPYGEFPTPTKAGYYFAGWFTAADGGDEVTAATKVTTASKHTLYAQWASAPVPAAYVISFHANGGEGAMDPQEFAKGAEVVLSDNAFTRVGYTFGHWSTDPDGGGAIYGNKQRVKLSQDTALYAKWIPDIGPVALDAAGVVPSVAFKKAQTVNGALLDANGIAGTVQVKLSNLSKGYVSVSATATLLSTGKKVSAKAVKIPLLEDGTLSGVLMFANPIGEMGFYMDASGEFVFEGDSYAMSAADFSVVPKGKFFLDSDFALAVPGELLAELLPWAFDFTATAKKWTFAKNASVKWANPKKGAMHTDRYDEASGKDLVVDTSKGKTNLSSLKLTYKPKEGTFSGTFKAYALEGAGKKRKLKAYTVNVTGLVIDGVGYGQATCKKSKSGPWPVAIK